ncbi:unnamed protein product [Gongylonema pulchrum]|uniref:NADH-ubiquinone oxidoreductase 15 kDa subunit n=1 Tax=Gongylonema pulchrum TaxID=637853 RepID=A0A183EAZ7_9BILA|nr:unnamed protein product [Gongylonema pulchrum]
MKCYFFRNPERIEEKHEGILQVYIYVAVSLYNFYLLDRFKPNTTVDPANVAALPKEDLFHPVRCNICSTSVGVYDCDEVFHFFNTVTQKEKEEIAGPGGGNGCRYYKPHVNRALSYPVPWAMGTREQPHFQEANERMLEPMIRLPLVDMLRRLSSKQGEQICKHHPCSRHQQTCEVCCNSTTKASEILDFLSVMMVVFVGNHSNNFDIRGDQYTICGFFESQYWHCLEAFGQKLGRKYCDLERRDFNECITNYKQVFLFAFFIEIFSQIPTLTLPHRLYFPLTFASSCACRFDFVAGVISTTGSHGLKT